MGKRATGFVGEIVYRCPNPRTLGVIPSIHEGKSYSRMVIDIAVVEFKDKTYEIWVHHLQSFQALIDDHKTKLKNHEAKLEQFKKDMKI